MLTLVLKPLIFWSAITYGIITKAQLMEASDLSCHEYEIGETRIVSVPAPWRSQILQTPPLKYKVQRVSQLNYIASVALEFSPHWSYDGPFSPDEVHTYYLGEVQHCMDLANAQMRGPHGERLYIHIEDARNFELDFIEYSIQIHGIESYSDMHGVFLYSSSIGAGDCPFIAHEVFHIFGFGDKYKHRLTKLVPSWLRTYLPQGLYSRLYYDQIFDCRATQIDSVMSHIERRWNNTFDLVNYSMREESLIDPAHFNAIIYGNCAHREDVRLFRECDRLSYQSSSFHPWCLRQKAYCERQNVLGRDRDKEIQRLNNALNDDDISYRGRLDLERRLHFVKGWPRVPQNEDD